MIRGALGPAAPGDLRPQLYHSHPQGKFYEICHQEVSHNYEKMSAGLASNVVISAESLISLALHFYYSILAWPLLSFIRFQKRQGIISFVYNTREWSLRREQRFSAGLNHPSRISNNELIRDQTF